MAIPKIIGAQRDFSSGELDVSMKRADESAAMKTGARQLLNTRVLNSKAVQNRSGRSIRYFDGGRIEQVTMSSGNIFDLVFGVGFLSVYNAAGTRVFTANTKGDSITPWPWTSANLGGITWVNIGLQIFIAYAAGAPNNPIQVLTWDGVSQSSTWTLSTFSEAITLGAQKRTLFYRISPAGITLLPSGVSGNINITFSAPVLTAAMIGTRLAFCGRQMTITGVTDSMHGTATVNEVLPPSETLPFTPSDPTAAFAVGDVVEGATSGAKGIVTAVAGPSTDTITVQIIPPNLGFQASEIIAGPGGSMKMGAATSGAPAAVEFWVDEVMNPFRGYPSSLAVDQGRLVATNFPSVPSGLAWSSIGSPTDLYVVPDVAVGSTASAIFEIAPGKSQVLYVVPGMESSEFVFCDNGIYFIPISVQNPLVPGSVAFINLSGAGIYPNVQPRRTEQTIIYMKAGGIQVGAVQAPGATNRPYIIDNVSDYHAHLFKGRAPVAIAIPSATSQFEETYIYILLSDATMVMGRYSMRNGLIEPTQDAKPSIGWLPWNGAGSVSWVSSLNATVLFSSGYPAGPGSSIGVVEVLDDTQYLDAAMFVNNPPAPLAPPLGKGPLWYLANGSVTLMDQGTRMMGTYQIDPNGFIIPEGNGGENLASATLVAGQPWTAIIEPFVPDAQPGNSAHQRMFKRRVSRLAVYVSQSTGFLMARLFAGPLTRTSPPLGTIMNTYRVTAYNQDDDPTLPPPLREEAQRWRPIGRAYDPRVAIIKDTPGPLLVHEIGIEASI